MASFPAAWVTKHKGRKVSMVLSGAMYMVGERLRCCHAESAISASMYMPATMHMLQVGEGLPVQFCFLVPCPVMSLS